MSRWSGRKGRGSALKFATWSLENFALERIVSLYASTRGPSYFRYHNELIKARVMSLKTPTNGMWKPAQEMKKYQNTQEQAKLADLRTDAVSSIDCITELEHIGIPCGRGTTRISTLKKIFYW